LECKGVVPFEFDVELLLEDHTCFNWYCGDVRLLLGSSGRNSMSIPPATLTALTEESEEEELDDGKKNWI